MVVISDPFFATQILLAAGVDTFVPLPSVANIVVKDGIGKLAGGAVLQDYTGPEGSTGMHCAGFLPGWLSRGVLWYTFDLAFNVLHTKKVIVKVPSTNYRSLKLATHLGFTFEARITDVFPDGDILVLSMYRDQCEWLTMPKPNVLVVDGTPKGTVQGTSNG